MIPYPAVLKSRSKCLDPEALTQPDIQESTTGTLTESKSPLPEKAENGEIFYGESEDNCTLTESPVYKNTGSYTVYYTVTKKNFDTISGSATVAITPAQPHSDGRIKM